MHDNQSHLMKTLTSFADPLEIRLGLPINDLLLAKFDEVSPVFDPFSLFGEFSTAAISIIPSLPLLLVTRITAEHKNKQVSACRLHVGRTSTVASIVNLATVQFVTLSFHLRRTKLTTRCDNQRAVEKFSKFRVFDKFLMLASLFLKTLKFPYNTVWVEGSIGAKKIARSVHLFQ